MGAYGNPSLHNLTNLLLYERSFDFHDGWKDLEDLDLQEGYLILGEFLLDERKYYWDHDW
jgi:hypothetical protein